MLLYVACSSWLWGTLSLRCNLDCNPVLGWRTGGLEVDQDVAFHEDTIIHGKTQLEEDLAVVLLQH